MQVTIKGKTFNNHLLIRILPQYLTLESDGNGTISADKLSGRKGELVTLFNTPNTNYEFDEYTITGATLTGNQFTFDDTNVTAKAWFTLTATAIPFTASGEFITTSWTNGTSPTSYVLGTKVNYHSDGIPTSWYANNVWNPSNASDYKITFNGRGPTVGASAVPTFEFGTPPFTITKENQWSGFVIVSQELINGSTQLAYEEKAPATGVYPPAQFETYINTNNLTSDKLGAWNLYNIFYHNTIPGGNPHFCYISANGNITWTATGIYTP